MDAAVILSTVLETLLTGYFINWSFAIISLLEMPQCLARS
jgi:hypothetical protein